VPELTQEVLDEHEYEKSPGKPLGRLMTKHYPRKGCSCGVRDYLKELIRHLRGLPNDLASYQKAAKALNESKDQGGAIAPCVHDIEKLVKKERRIVIQEWWDRFSDTLLDMQGKS
jgi:hypothetical protein